MIKDDCLRLFLCGVTQHEVYDEFYEGAGMKIACAGCKLYGRCATAH
jgi:hypothetical protein